MDWKWIPSIIIGIIGIVVAVVVLHWQLKHPKRVLRSEFWRFLQGQKDIADLYDLSSDRDFTLALVSYLTWAKQVIWFSTPAPQALPSLQESYLQGTTPVGAGDTISGFWEDWFKDKKGSPQIENRAGIIRDIVERRILQGEKLTETFGYRKFKGSVRYLLQHFWSVWRLFLFKSTIKKLREVQTTEIDVKGFSQKFLEHLKKRIVKDYLLYVMNKDSRGRADEEEEAIANLMVCLYWNDKLRSLFEKVAKPWSPGIHDLTKYARIPLRIVKPGEVGTIDRIINDERVILFSTGGGAWLLEHTVNYLELKWSKDYPSLIEKHLRGQPSDDLQRRYDKFWDKFDEINEGKSLLFCFFQHPFQDRVLWEIVRGENLRLPAEMLANRRAFLKKYENKGCIRVIWYREPFFYAGHMQYRGEERFKNRFDFYYQIYPAFGRTRASSRFIALGPGVWEGRGIIYKIFKKPFEFSDDVEEVLVNGVQPSAIPHRAEINLTDVSNLQMDVREGLRRQLTIDKFLEDAKSNSISTLYNFLRLPWFPYFEIGESVASPLDEAKEMDFANPLTWKGSGLLALFGHESELAYKILAALKILKEWFKQADPSTRLYDEKSPSLTDSLKLVEDYIANEYIEETESLCKFLESASEMLKSNTRSLEQFQSGIKVMKENVKKIKIVMEEDWVNKQDFEIKD